MKKFVKFFAVVLTMFAFSGCGNKAVNIDVNTVYSGISPMTEVTLVKMNDNYISNYYGINVADLDQYVFAQSEDPKSAETIVIFKCDDNDKRAEYMTAVENAMNQKYDELSNYNLPEEAKLVKDSKVYSEGSIVYLVISDNAKDMNSIIKDSIS